MHGARDILRQLPVMVTPVALVQLERGRLPDLLVELLREFRVSHLQVYGDVTVPSLASLAEEGYQPMPVVAVRDADFAGRPADWIVTDGPHRPRAVVLDTFDPTLKGGTGRPFRWDWVSAAREAGKLANWPDLVLAGGLNPGNVAEAARLVRPHAVDVSSGVEVDGCPGKKDAAKMHAFVRAVRAASDRMR